MAHYVVLALGLLLAIPQSTVFRNRLDPDIPVVVTGTVRRVFTGGTVAPTYPLTPSGFQTALNDATPGDTIYVQNNVDLAGTFVLPAAKPCAAQDNSCLITVRSGIDSAGNITGTFPVDNVRYSPTGGYTPLARFKSTVNNIPSIRTIYPSESVGCAPSCVTAFWKLQLLEFIPNAPWRANSMLIVGTNGDPLDLPGLNGQNLYAEVAHHIYLDQIYLHGDSLHGQNRGMTMAARNVILQNSWCADIFTVAVETQCISIINTMGPFWIINNYLSAAGEVILTGGGDPYGQFDATVLASPTRTVTSARISQCPELGTTATHQWFSIEVGGVEYERMIETINTSTCDITWSPSLPALPDQPGDANNVHWSWTFGGLVVEKNYITKNLAWKTQMIAPPDQPAATILTSGGTCAAGTVTYQVISFLEGTNGSDNDYWSAASTGRTVTVSTNNRVSLSWPAVTNAYRYRVYRGTSYYDTTSPSFTDTCAAPTGTATAPTTPGIPIAKNTFELKSCDGLSNSGRCLVRGNVIENSYVMGQDGMALNIKSWNQDGGDDSGVIRDTDIEYNWVRNSSMAAQFCSMDCDGKGSGVMTRLRYRHNLHTDITTANYGYAGKAAFFFTAGNFPGAPPITAGSSVEVSHNTVLNNIDTWGLIEWDVIPAGNFWSDFVFTNNLTRHAQNGMHAILDSSFGGGGEGTTGWNNATTGAGRLVSKNVYVGLTTPTTYPDTPNNWAPSESEFQTAFVSYATCINPSGSSTAMLGCAMSATGPYHQAGTDGTDLGVDIVALKFYMDIAIGGDNR